MISLTASATASSKPVGAFSPVPTAVPPRANSFSSGSAISSSFLSFSRDALQPLISCENVIGVASCKCVRPLFTMPSFSFSSVLKVSISLSRAGNTLSSIPTTAAMLIAVGKVSLDDCDIFISSLGWSSFLPAISLPLFAITSFAFILDCVPEPVCHTTRGKCSFRLPSITSSQACEIAFSFSSVIFSGFSLWLAIAAAFFSTPNACVISLGITSMPTPILKFS